MKPPERIETQRLVLRRPALSDAPAVFASWVQDEEVTRYLTWKPHRDLAETEEMLRRAMAAWEGEARFLYMIELQEPPFLVGMIDLRIQSSLINLGYVLARPYWGRGYMTEAVRAVIEWAFQQPEIRRVEATTDTENLASQRVLEKAGMVCEGTLPKHILHPMLGSEPRDSLMFATVK